MSICFVDYRSTKEEISSLESLGHNVIKMPKCNTLYNAIDGHCDIQMHITPEKNIIVHKDIDENFLKKLKELNISYIISSEKLQNKYPYNISLNAITTKEYIIHNIKYTSKELLNLSKDKKVINVKQGYTKCSCALVSDNAVITSDKGIQKKLLEKKFDVLLIKEGSISLDGLDYGFIGGCTGLLPNKKFAFFGSVLNHPSKKEILSFLKKYDLEPVFLSQGILKDRGSILVY